MKKFSYLMIISSVLVLSACQKEEATIEVTDSTTSPEVTTTDSATQNGSEEADSYETLLSFKDLYDDEDFLESFKTFLDSELPNNFYLDLSGNERYVTATSYGEQSAINYIYKFDGEKFAEIASFEDEGLNFELAGKEVEMISAPVYRLLGYETENGEVSAFVIMVMDGENSPGPCSLPGLSTNEAFEERGALVKYEISSKELSLFEFPEEIVAAEKVKEAACIEEIQA